MTKSHQFFRRYVFSLPPRYALWLQAAAKYAKCTPEDVVCLALREWVRSPERCDFARDVERASKVRPP